MAFAKSGKQAGRGKGGEAEEGVRKTEGTRYEI